MLFEDWSFGIYCSGFVLVYFNHPENPSLTSFNLEFPLEEIGSSVLMIIFLWV